MKNTEQKNRSALWLMALTILVDFTGFGLIIPLLPFWAQHLGANVVGITLASAAYALAQFLFTPMLGALSDRYGRKPIIVGSLLIEAVSLIFTALAGTLPMLLIARFVGGLGASNIGSAQAVVADVTSPQERARGMGMIGAAIGLGFVLGPALGGTLSPLGPTVPFWVAAGIAAINIILVLILLPETKKRRSGIREGKHGGVMLLFAGWGAAKRSPAILNLVFVNLLFTIAFTGMENIFALFGQRYFNWGASQIGYIFTYVGVIVVIMQGGLVRTLVKSFSEQRVLLGGLVILAAGLLLLAFSHSVWLVLVTLALISIGDGAVTPTASTLLSFASEKETQGEILGLAQGVGGLARIIGPLLAGAIYQTGGPGSPFIAGGILVVLAAVVALPALSAIHMPTHEIETQEKVSATEEKVSAEFSSSAGKRH
jgi:DHA1 family tetracycline resistance protein-like MFS transporter